MVEGTYDVAVDTPKHHKRGLLSLSSAGSNIAARLKLADMDPLDFAGTCNDKDFTIEGTGQFGSLGEVEYTAEGNVWGNSVTINCSTNIGRIEIFGTQISASAGGVKSSHDYIMQASTGEFGNDDSMMYSGLYADGG